MASVSNRGETTSLPGTERPSAQPFRGSPARRVDFADRSERRPVVAGVPVPTGSIAAIELSLGF